MSRKNNQSRSKKKGNNAKGSPAAVNKQSRNKNASKPTTTHTKILKQLHVKKTCAISNPLCPSAKGSGRPDGLGLGSIPFQCRGSIPVTTDASGAALIVLVPGYGRYCYNTGTLAAGTWTTTANWLTQPGSAFLTANAGETRLVSVGAHFRSIASATNCQGLVHSFTILAPTVSQTYSALNNNNPEDNMMPMTSGFEMTWISKPMGSSAHSFRQVALVSNTMYDFDWTSVGIEIVGGPASTTIGYLEVVQNVEFQLSGTAVSATGLSGVSRPTVQANPVAIAAQAQVHSAAPSLLKGGLDKLETSITNYASSALESMFAGAADFGLSMLGL